MPRFAHLSLLLKPDGKGKLSKRDGDRLGFPVFPLRWVNPETKEVTRGYREDGYYPEAFVNLLALLGWNPGTEQEIFSLKELVEAFSLERVVKSGARFNPEKAKWFNEQYLRMKAPEQLAAEFKPVAEAKVGHALDDKFLAEVCELVKERLHFSNELWDVAKPLFVAPTEYVSEDVAKFCTLDNKPRIEELLSLIKASDIDSYDRPQIEELLTGRIKEKGWKMGQVMNTLRLYFTGNTKGLGIADIIYFIKKAECVSRIEKGLKATYQG